MGFKHTTFWSGVRRVFDAPRCLFIFNLTWRYTTYLAEVFQTCWHIFLSTEFSKKLLFHVR